MLRLSLGWYILRLPIAYLARRKAKCNRAAILITRLCYLIIVEYVVNIEIQVVILVDLIVCHLLAFLIKFQIIDHVQVPKLTTAQVFLEVGRIVILIAIDITAKLTVIFIVKGALLIVKIRWLSILHHHVHCLRIVATHLGSCIVVQLRLLTTEIGEVPFSSITLVVLIELLLGLLHIELLIWRTWSKVVKVKLILLVVQWLLELHLLLLLWRRWTTTTCHIEQIDLITLYIIRLEVFVKVGERVILLLLLFLLLLPID